MLYDVYATSDPSPVAPGDTVTLQLVAAGVEVDDASADPGTDAVNAALSRADLRQLKMGGLVATPSDGFTHKLVTVSLVDAPANVGGTTT